jgi:hypothetical protein
MIICFSGYKGNGKDSMADHLIKEHGAIRVALADPLKDSVAEEFGIDRGSLDDPKRKESPILSLPVDPKDAYSKMIANFLVKEFRTADGEVPFSMRTDEGGNRGIIATEKAQPSGALHKFETVYWTPRALAILKGSSNRSVTSNYWTARAFGVMEGELNEDPNRLIVVTDVRYRSELTQFKEKFGDNVAFVRVERFKDSPSTDPSERDLDEHKFDYYVNNTGTLEEAYDQVEKILTKIGLNHALDELAKEIENLNLQFK